MPFIKAHLLKVANPTLKSFSIRHDYLPYFYNQYHYHPEVELLFIQEGTGTQFVGDSIQRFEGGDLLLIGSDCPHYLRSDNKYFSGDPNLYVSALVIHFNPSIFGKDFLALLENRHIDQLLEKSKKGLRILGSLKSEITEIMKKMIVSNKGNMMLALYALLDLLASVNEYELLGTRIMEGDHNDKETERINAIYTYAAKHFKRKISIEEIAGVAHLSANSFCRYFKNKTKKNFSHFLNEIRVEYACKKIRENQLQVTQVGYEAGFNNFVNFNNAFKKITGKTPTQYAKQFSNT
jgi:AraC-like DNA-binding protein